MYIEQVENRNIKKMNTDELSQEEVQIIIFHRNKQRLEREKAAKVYRGYEIAQCLEAWEEYKEKNGNHRPAPPAPQDGIDQ